jgi:hypothetical protein
MIAYIDIDSYNNKFLYFNESIKNNVIDNGNFIRVIYSNNNYVINVLYIVVPFSKLKKIYNNCYSIDDNLVCQKLCNIENSILNNYSSIKTKEFKLKEQLNQGYIKILNYKDNSNIILIKISGVWEDKNKDKYGLTYKFIQV